MIPLGSKNYANLEFPSRTITVRTRDRHIKLRIEATGNTIPIVSSDPISKIIKKSLFTYMVCIQSLSPTSVSKDVNVNHAAMFSSSGNVSSMETDASDDNHDEF